MVPHILDSSVCAPGWVVRAWDSFPTQGTGTRYQLVVSWLKSFLAHMRLGGHHWLIDKWSHIYWIAVYVYSHSILWDGVVGWVSGLFPSVLHSLKLIIEIYLFDTITILWNRNWLSKISCKHRKGFGWRWQAQQKVLLQLLIICLKIFISALIRISSRYPLKEMLWKSN